MFYSTFYAELPLLQLFTINAKRFLGAAQLGEHSNLSDIIEFKIWTTVTDNLSSTRRSGQHSPPFFCNCWWRNGVILPKVTRGHGNRLHLQCYRTWSGNSVRVLPLSLHPSLSIIRTKTSLMMQKSVENAAKKAMISLLRSLIVIFSELSLENGSYTS